MEREGEGEEVYTMPTEGTCFSRRVVSRMKLSICCCVRGCEGVDGESEGVSGDNGSLQDSRVAVDWIREV